MTRVIDLTDAPRPPHVGLVLTAWTVLVAAMAVSLAVKDGVPWPNAIRSAAIEYYTLAALSVPLWVWSRRLAEKNRTVPRVVLGHVLLGTAIVTVWQGVHVLYSRLAVGPGFWARVYGDNWPYQMVQALFLYGSLLGFTLVIQASQRARAQEMREAELRLQARDAELSAVRAQIKPHFLCNALTSLMALIDRNPAEARRMTERLGDFLRGTFDRLDDDTITLESECDLLGAYFELEGLRFQSRLRTELRIAPAAATALIPPFLLQPLVENAIKHGVARTPGGGTIAVTAEVAEGRLRIGIRSPRRAFAGHPPVEGRGLLLTRRRLEQLYGADGYALSYADEPEGFVVNLELPARSDAG